MTESAAAADEEEDEDEERYAFNSFLNMLCSEEEEEDEEEEEEEESLASLRRFTDKPVGSKTSLKPGKSSAIFSTVCRCNISVELNAGFWILLISGTSPIS